MKNGANLLLECVKNQKVNKLFGVPGESYLSILDQLLNFPEMKWIGARQEGGAAFMASAYAQLTGNPGVCFVTRGPGSTNASIGVHTASQGSIPLILFIGQVSSELIGREAFQELDYKLFFNGMAKWVTEINNVNRIPEIIGRAFATALSGRQGPVVVSLPENILSENTQKLSIERVKISEPSISEEAFEKLKIKLSCSKRPLALVGGTGWSRKGIEDFHKFIDKNKIPVISSFRRQDIFDNNSESYVGVAGFGKNQHLRNALNDCDLILAFNSLIGDVVTDGYELFDVPKPKQYLIHVNPSDRELGKVYQPDFPIHCGPNILSNLLSKSKPLGNWQKYTKILRQNHLNTLKVPEQPGNLDMGLVMQCLQESLPNDVIFTNGAGNFSLWSNVHFRFSKNARLLAPTSGAMGFGLPAALVAKLTYPKKTVICFAGDGDIQMNIAELGIAMQYKCFPIIIIINNSSYGTIRMHQEKSFPNRVNATDIINPNFALLSKSYGFSFSKVEKTKDFDFALKTALNKKNGAIIELVVSIESITPSKTLSSIKNS